MFLYCIFHTIFVSYIADLDHLKIHEVLIKDCAFWNSPLTFLPFSRFLKNVFLSYLVFLGFVLFFISTNSKMKIEIQIEIQNNRALSVFSAIKKTKIQELINVDSYKLSHQATYKKCESVKVDFMS